jgi:tRNA-splicing ligase RtcB (3'-phosphate/5'-hydroxy nucleic acid ligase)
MAESLKQFLGKEAVPIFGWTQGVPVEEQAMQQLKNIASLPFIHKHVAVMPDVHLGKGATIGSVIPTKGAIVPAAVGVDLGCGMMAVRTSIRAEHLPDSLADIRSAIEKAVPHGRTTVGKHYDPSKDRGLWYNTPEINQIRFKALEGGLKAILEKQNDKLLNRAAAGAEKQLGTLGTGNHFIEVCLDENDDVWVMLHSGSRGIGNRIATHFIEKAQELVKMWFVHPGSFSFRIGIA